MASRPPGDRDEPPSEGDLTDPEGVQFDGTATLRTARKAGDAGPVMIYAVHTRTCTYLLDESGVCRRIAAQQGAVPPHVMQCVGAQFVACLDLREQGGLVAELRPGAMGLFVRNTEPGRMVLLRTAPIESVDGAEGGAFSRDPTPAFGDRAVHEGVQYGKQAGVPVGLENPSFFAVRTWGAEQTVTVTPSSFHPQDERKPK